MKINIYPCCDVWYLNAVANTCAVSLCARGTCIIIFDTIKESDVYFNREKCVAQYREREFNRPYSREKCLEMFESSIGTPQEIALFRYDDDNIRTGTILEAIEIIEKCVKDEKDEFWICNDDEIQCFMDKDGNVPKTRLLFRNKDEIIRELREIDAIANEGGVTQEWV
jgi:hypothetical protein